MKRARYGFPGGEPVTPEEFINRASLRYKERGIFPYCPACKQIVHVYGVHSPTAPSRFDHLNLDKNALAVDDCFFAHRNSRFSGLYTDDWDDHRGKRLRSEFLKEDNLKIAYAFCLNLCRSHNLPAWKFRKMLERADNKNIWAYAGIPLWVIPYILLTLEDFTATSKSGKEFGFHFVFQKPSNTSASSLWLQASECKIKKIFASNDKLVVANDNPYELSEEAMLQKAKEKGDTSWIKKDLIQALKPVT